MGLFQEMWQLVGFEKLEYFVGGEGKTFYRTFTVCTYLSYGDF